MADTRFWNVRDSLETVDPAVCAECHAEVVDRYARSAKAHALQRLDHGPHDGLHTAAAPQRYADSARRLQYRFFWDRGHLRLEETELPGRPPHRREERLDFAVGSAHNTQTHLVQFNGYLYQAPLSMTEEGQPHLPAGFEAGHNSRFSRAVTPECVSCHSDYPQRIPGSRHGYHRIPTGISCRACHGPGAAHVRRMRRGETIDTAAEADFSIVQPRKLKPAYRDGMCRRCHLVGSAVLAPGQEWSDYRPGMKLEAVARVFLPRFNDPEDARYMATYFDRMQASVCYAGSRDHPQMERLSCVSCHNPHAAAGANTRMRYNEVCSDCHQPQHPDQIACALSRGSREAQDNDCVSCHMPRTQSGNMDLPHVTAHDHRIALPGVARDTMARSRDMPFDALRSPHTAHNDARTLAQAYLFYYEKFGAKPFLLDSARTYIQRIGEPEQTRWRIYYDFLRGGASQAIITGARNLPDSFWSRDHRLCYQVGQAFEDHRQWDSAAAYYRRAVDLMPRHPDYQLKLGAAWLAARDTTRAGPLFRKMLRRYRHLPQVHNNLAFLALLRFDLPQAKLRLEEALRLNPDYPEAYINWAKYHLGRQDLQQASRALERARQLRPNDPAVQRLQQLIRRASR